MVVFIVVGDFVVGMYFFGVGFYYRYVCSRGGW